MLQNIPYPVRLPRPTVDLCVPHTCSGTDIYNIISQCKYWKTNHRKRRNVCVCVCVSERMYVCTYLCV